MLDDVRRRLLVQSAFAPLDTAEAIADHIAALREETSWDRVGVLADERPTAIVVILLKDERVVAAFRFSLAPEQFEAALRDAVADGHDLVLAVLQGESFSVDQISDLDLLSDVWTRCAGQSAVVDWPRMEEFLRKVEEECRDRGRGDDISKATKQEVWFDAHGRCMYPGCGLDLTTDPISGREGNFAYLAHNIASGEQGPRAIPVLSGELSNDPKNILLLCDTHHRLVDVVARSDHPAHVLSEFRSRFCRAASELLSGLSLPPVPVFCLSWPVHQQTISVPSSLQIAQSLAPIGVRIDGLPQQLSDNEVTLRNATGDVEWSLLASQVNAVADRLLMQVHKHSYRAALFAMGLMPALVALGAKLGNKCEITPMLRHRESNIWYWPASTPRGEFWEVEGVDSIKGECSELTLAVALTAEPAAMIRAAGSLGFRIIRVRAKEGYLGNGALAHPADGNLFRQRMQELVYEIADRHRVQRVNLLPCASNAACVFLGQAFDSHHPEWRVYDFAGEAMVPRLRLENIDNACVVSAA